MFLIGTIVGTHGIKGEVKVRADSSFDRFVPGNILYLKKNNEYIEIKIDSHRRHKNYDLITFNNIKNINDVLKYINCTIHTNHDDQELNEDEYFYEDLIAKKVYDTNNNFLGVVRDIREVPQGIILEVENQKTFLIPFVSEFIKDIGDDKIIINVIEGLI